MYQLSVSVIVTCRNLHDFLPECIESIKAQTMRVTEIIVVHDACEPPPVFPGTTTVVRDIHKGIGHTRNQGALLATSETLLFVDADDVLSENFIEAMVQVKAETKADIIYPNVLLWSYWHPEVKLKNAWHESAETITLENMLEYNQIVVSSLIPRELYFKAGGTPDLPTLEDYKLWLECLRLGATFAKSKQSVLKYRQRQNGRLQQSQELKNQFYYQIRGEFQK